MHMLFEILIALRDEKIKVMETNNIITEFFRRKRAANQAMFIRE